VGTVQGTLGGSSRPPATYAVGYREVVNRPLTGVKTRLSEEPYVNSTSTVLWEAARGNSGRLPDRRAGSGSGLSDASCGTRSREDLPGIDAELESSASEGSQVGSGYSIGFTI